jgi:uncharacterized protein (DUF924 family)
MSTWVDDVLAFWFAELKPGQWFNGGAALDEIIARRFAEVHRQTAAATAEALRTDADTALAAIIVLDQFSRNMFRGTAAAFATDGKALGLAQQAITAGFDGQVPPDRRIFFYLPFEHAEDAAHQQRAVELISALGNTEFTEYALAHQTVIGRFGRFPHRNAVLGRSSTAEEYKFLLEPGSSF